MNTQPVSAPANWQPSGVALICAIAREAVIAYEYAAFGYPQFGTDPETDTRLDITIENRVLSVLNHIPPTMTLPFRMQDSLVDAIATAHRDHDHWNDPVEEGMVSS